MLDTTVVKPTTAGGTGAKQTCFLREGYLPAHAAEWAAFVDAATKGGALPVTLADGIAAHDMAEAATQSAGTGQPVTSAGVLG